jgi:carboxylesterase
MPWYGGLLRLARPGLLPFAIDLPERDPYGVKDPRVRALVLRKMQTGAVAEAGFFTTPLMSFAHHNVLSTRVRRRLKDVTRPVLLVHPRQDDIASIGNALMLQRRLAGPVTTLVLEDSYHLVTLDRQRHDVASAVVAFCDRIKSGDDVTRDTLSGPHVVARGPVPVPSEDS